MRTRLLLLFGMLFLTFQVQSQIVHLVNNNKEKNTKNVDNRDKEKNVTQWLEGGNIDYISSGLLQTNARLFKVNIGNPKGFYVPFYIMAGADKETSSGVEEDPNQSTNVNLLSANGGYLNFGLHGNSYLTDFKKHDKGKNRGKDSDSNTRLAFVWLLGAKSITGKDATTQERVSMLSFVTHAGLMFQTNAWVPEDDTKKGIAWLQAVFTNTYNDEDKLKQIYGPDINKNFFGFNIEGGVQVDEYINLRVGYYRYLNNTNINDDFKDGIFKLSVDFGILN